MLLAADDLAKKSQNSVGSIISLPIKYLHCNGLFYTGSFEELSDSVVNSAYLGTVYVNDVECHYLTFREAKVDWQLWVRAEGDPLPMKYVITTKWITGAPQYAIRFRDWNTNPQIVSGFFDFKAPEGAKKLEAVHANRMGDLVIEGGE